ncbi:MAG: HAMP domain-containing sensor histidine kinase [Clostridia bacterium]|nr:HAMP domain-containing sensor histidine kinase [Clostridia bacterium]
MKKVKKSIFMRIFSINLITILVSVVILATTQSVLISQYVYKDRINGLKENANTIAAFIESGTVHENLKNFLYGFSHSTKTNILIVDANGEVLLASTYGDTYNENTIRIEEKFRKDVMSNNEKIIKGTLGDVYRLEMFTLQVPIVAKAQKAVIGAIFVSVPVPELNRSQLQLYRILAVSILLVILISFALSFELSRRISRPIKKIGNSAKQFAQGDFSSRVNLDEKTESIIEINELTQTFNDMAYSLEKADDIRNNFLSDVAHELRTPMTTISGFVDGILDETVPPERQRDYLVIVRDEIARLSSLVNSFLSLTRLQTGNQTLEITNFDVNETIRRTLVNFENKINEKEILVNLDLDDVHCFVKADMNLIRQVLTNLIENAIKFTNPGGELKVSVKSGRSEAEVSVYNTGCGIAESDKKLIFERFYKADKSRSLNREGTGIGLYIVKDILNRHGKNIEVSSREGEFAEFKFYLDKGKN